MTWWLASIVNLMWLIRLQIWDIFRTLVRQPVSFLLNGLFVGLRFGGGKGFLQVLAGFSIVDTGYQYLITGNR